MYDELFGEINGQSIYDYDQWDSTMEDDCSVYTKQDVLAHVGKKAITWNWKCKDGSLLKIEDMTDKHLENSIKYCERTNSIDSLKRLQHEENRRRSLLQKKCLDLLKQNCQFCGDTMNVKPFKHESHPNDGPGRGWSYTDYKLVCSCGATGPIIKTEGYKP